MPTLSSMKIPPPKSWQEFEDIVLSALRLRWKSSDLTKNGRPGQKQDGVDIYGHDDMGRLVGIQGKNTTSGITFKVVESEIEKASSFKPTRRCLFVATSAPTDANLQKEVRLLSQHRVNEDRFPVGILFWEDIIQDLTTDEQVFNKHYPQLSVRKTTQIFDATKLTDSKVPVTLEKFNDTLNLQLTPEQLKPMIEELAELTKRIAKLPVTTRQFLCIIINRTKGEKEGLLSSGINISLAEIQHACRLSDSELRDQVTILEDCGFACNDFEGDRGAHYLTLFDANRNWPVWNDLYAFAAKANVDLSEILIELKFDLLD